METAYVIRRVEDGSYVIDKNGMPYHVPREWTEEWEAVNRYAQEHPDIVTEEQPPAPLTLEEQKNARLAEINAAYNLAVSSLVSTYPSTELLTFDKQETEARAWLADSSAETPLVDALAEGRGMDKAELVSRIIKKADAFAVATGYLTGQRQKYEDELGAAVTAEEVEAIVPDYRMPQGLNL